VNASDNGMLTLGNRCRAPFRGLLEVCQARERGRGIPRKGKDAGILYARRINPGEHPNAAAIRQTPVQKHQLW
ncbi:MAG: hypothetical protein ACYDCF_08965, partial [Burkholderiales bacterium]